MNVLRQLVILLGLCGIFATGAGAQAARDTGGLIGQLDTVEIRVFREDDLTTRGQLSADGSITMPLIGAVRLVGLTTDQAASAIAAKLRDGYLVRPEVSVSIEARVRRTVTLLGEVQRPGLFELPVHRPLTLVEAIGLAGGATRIANVKKITLKRNNGGPYTINLNDITSGKAKDVPLQDGDVVTIPESIF